ncbi:MAG: phosphotransferase [Acidimicrobiia bacterium]
MNELYKDFPPGWGHVKVPTTSREAALSGLTLYAACRRRGLWAQRLAWAGIRLAGPWVIPGRRLPWSPPMDTAIWRELRRRWRDELGEFDSLAIYERAQASRLGLATLLLAQGRPVAFVKLRLHASAELDSEARALQLMLGGRPEPFSVPQLLGTGAFSGWHYLACAPLPPGIHHPAHSPPLKSIVVRIEEGLASLERPAGTPSHWRPMHGDLTPWNLRRAGPERLVLTDWEEAGWGPPGADEVLYRTAEAALWRRRAGVSDHIEAVRFWRERVAARPQDDRDYRLTRLLSRALDRMEAQL